VCAILHLLISLFVLPLVVNKNVHKRDNFRPVCGSLPASPSRQTVDDAGP